MADVEKKSRELVVFYSWGNNTKVVAEYIKEKTGADILELKVKAEYPSDYDQCVSKVGRDGKHYEPELLTEIPDLSCYDLLYVGSPCWWGTIANPLRTFLHHSDLKGKTIAPFMTHGTSGIHVQDVKKLCTGVKVVKGCGIYNSYQVDTQINTPENMEAYKSKIDEWLSHLK